MHDELLVKFMIDEIEVHCTYIDKIEFKIVEQFTINCETLVS